MNIDKIFCEEDLFPREFANFEARDYGILFYDENNKDSYDSNHAVIFKEKIEDLDAVLENVAAFYEKKGLKAILYQATAEEGYFASNTDVFAKHGFKTWEEEIRFMVPVEENHLATNPEILVKRVTEWDEAFATEIFEKAGEPWEIGVAKRMIRNSNTVFLVAYYQGYPVGMTYVHVRSGVCRYDYILVSKEHRRIGVGRALMNALVEYCKEQRIENCYLWPAGEEAQRIYLEAGFQTVAVKKAGRAAVGGVMLEYKEFGSGFLEEIKEIYKEQGWIAYLNDDEKLKRAYDNSLYVYGIFDESKLIGFLRCVGDGEHIVVIEDLVIKTEYQRQGLGTKLLQHVFEKYADVRMLSLYTDKVDIKANSFYKKMGMRLVEEMGAVSYIR